MNTLHDTKSQDSTLKKDAAENRQKMEKPVLEVILFEKIDIITASTPENSFETPEQKF